MPAVTDEEIQAVRRITLLAGAWVREREIELEQNLDELGEEEKEIAQEVIDDTKSNIELATALFKKMDIMG